MIATIKQMMLARPRPKLLSSENSAKSGAKEDANRTISVAIVGMYR